MSAGWEGRIDPGSEEVLLQHRDGGLPEAMPDYLKVADMDPSAQWPRERAYNEKKSLAGQASTSGGGGQNQGAIYYQNNVNGSRSGTCPSRWILSNCFNIETFKCNDNLLRDLPESMSLLTDLRLFECDNYLGKLPLGMGELTAHRKCCACLRTRLSFSQSP